MAQLFKFIPRIFAGSSSADQISKFGSLAANAPEFTTDAEDAQALSNYDSGWFSAVIGGNSPCIEDMNAMFFIITTWLAYINQQGVPEWDNATDYYNGSVVQADGFLYVCINANSNSEPYLNPTDWNLLAQPSRISSHTSDPAGAAVEEINECDASGGSFNFTLPPLAGVPKGHKMIIKVISTGANTVTPKASGAETIEGSVTYGTALRSTESLTVYKSDDTTWRTL